MFRSIEEMTARLKFLNLRLKFHTSYNTHPIVIKYKGSVVNEINLYITQIEQKEEIIFEGFSPNDAQQKVSCTLEYNKKEVDVQSISSLQMQNNQYVANVIIKNCKDIRFNGRLDLIFSKHWFKHNILSGANLDDEYVHWDTISFTDQELFCVGDSFTFGHGVEENETWPSLLNRNAFNFGSQGLSHDGCVRNVKYILQNSKHVKQIICLLPGPTRKLFDFEFLGCKGTIPIGYNNIYNLPVEFTGEINNIKKLIIKGSIDHEWVKACTDIVDMCDKHNVECWLSTWYHSMYTHIPIKHRLPEFPQLKIFKERATDGMHPHKKHYELFVDSIIPYIQ